MRPGDGPAILSCVRALAESHGVLSHVTASADALERQILGNVHLTGCEIAELDGVPAGYALWHRSFSSFSARPAMYLEDVSVLPEFRRQGVARELMRRIADISLSRGFSEVY